MVFVFPIVVLIVVIVVPVVALVFIPLVVVVDLAMLAIPVAIEVLLAIMVRCHPGGALVGRARPVSFVPFVAVPLRVLVTSHPNVSFAGAWWLHPHYAVWRRRANSDPNGNLREDSPRGQQHQYKHFNLHDWTPFLSIA